MIYRERIKKNRHKKTQGTPAFSNYILALLISAQKGLKLILRYLRDELFQQAYQQV